MTDNTEKRQLKISLSGKTYSVKHNWLPSDFLQCGKGVVFSKKGNYSTAFFEAFPLNTFIRGESGRISEDEKRTDEELIEMAENNAWEVYQKYLACENDGGHHFERLNNEGKGKCKDCGIKIDEALDNINTCVCCEKSPAFFTFPSPKTKKDEHFCFEHYQEKLNSFDFFSDETYGKKEEFEFLPDFYIENTELINSKYKEININFILSLLITNKLNELTFNTLLNEYKFNENYKLAEKIRQTIEKFCHEFIFKILKEKGIKDFHEQFRASEEYFHSKEFLNLLEKIDFSKSKEEIFKQLQVSIKTKFK